MSGVKSALVGAAASSIAITAQFPFELARTQLQTCEKDDEDFEKSIPFWTRIRTSLKG